jgi:hypothetical protein
MRSTMTTGLICGMTLLFMSGVVTADEKLKGIACRSVHLGYPAPTGISFYNEVKIEQSASGTYFMVCGWSKGYFGIQEQGQGKKVVLFSVWDPGDQNDPKSVKEEQRVKLLHQGEGVRVGRFGNEGTGGQSFFDYDWKVGETYQFLVTAKAVENRSEYSGYFFIPEKAATRSSKTSSETRSRRRRLAERNSAMRGCKRKMESGNRSSKPSSLPTPTRC